MSGIRFIDPPGRGSSRRPLGPGLLAVAGAVVAALFLLSLIEMFPVTH